MARSSQKKYLVVQEQDPGVTSEHPFKNEKNHQLLLEYLLERIDYACSYKDTVCARYEDIDKAVNGFLVPTKDDRERKKKQLLGESTSPTEMRIQLIETQLKRIVTYLCSVFSPDSGIYEVVTEAAQQSIANGVTQLMNKHAIKGRYFRQQSKAFFNALKYNLGAFEVEWIENYKKKLKDRGGKVYSEDALDYAGNQFNSLDMYNTFYDPTVNVLDCFCKGEFAGYVEMVTPFQVKKKVEDGEYFNTADLFTENPQPTRRNFYYQPPLVRYDIDPGTSSSGTPNWDFILTVGRIKGNEQGSYEKVTIYCKLIPGEFGLIPRAKRKDRSHIEIWKFVIVNQSHIVYAEHMNNIHEYIPIFFITPNEDDLGMQSKSYAEVLNPFQEFGSFLLNAHIKSARKGIWDFIIYDPSYIDLSAAADDVAGRFPVTPLAFGKDITKAIWKPDFKLDTKETLSQLQQVMEMMEYIYPTRMAQQVTDIDRAVKDQVTAALQAGHRDSWKLARTLDEQGFSPARFVMLSNIVQYQTQIKLQVTGQEVTIDPTVLRNMELEFKVGEGLKMIDRTSRILGIRDLISQVLGSQAYVDFDVPALLNYGSSLMGDETDLTKFRRTTPIPEPGGGTPRTNNTQTGQGGQPKAGAQ
jgi:hypothetical protein